MSGEEGAQEAGGRTRIAAPIVLLGLLLAGCASQPLVGSYGGAGGALDGQGSYRVGRPYEIKGEWYYPAVDYSYDKTGVASWYGQYFQGRATANGEIFDLNQLTAANTTLPMPSIVQVTNLQNRRSLRLRVNDRGPFVDHRLIDVSRRAAQLLGFAAEGTAPVEVKIVKDASIEVAEEAMHNSGQGRVMVADSAAAAIPALAAPPPPSAAYATAAPPAKTPGETAPRTMARAAPPRFASPLPPPVARLAMLPSAPPAQASHPPPSSTRPYAALSQFALISPAEAAPLPRAAAPLTERKTLIRPLHIAEMPLSRSKVIGGSRPSEGRIFVQAGAFLKRDNARRVESRIAPLGSVRVMTVAVNGLEVYRVRLGPVESRQQADRLLQRVVGSGYREARIVTD